MITHKGIEVNPDQIKAIHDLHPPRNPKEVQRLTEMTSASNKFILRFAKRCRPFFQLLHKWNGFSWSEECDMAFEELKAYLANPLLRTNFSHHTASFHWQPAPRQHYHGFLGRSLLKPKRAHIYTKKVLKPMVQVHSTSSHFWLMIQAHESHRGNFGSRGLKGQ